ncbi:MAG: hypothetical protein RI955_705 [Bacteroidota bacterium]
MNEDDTILLLCFLIFWTTLFGLTKTSKKWKITLFPNVIVHVVYSSYLLYELFNNPRGGTSLFWVFYLLFILAVHELVILTALVINLFKRKK